MMTRPDIDIDDAIANAAGGYAHTDLAGTFDTPLAITRRIGHARGTIKRFLENVPDDATVLDLRQAIEETE
jgi:hypothetical protein